MNYVYLYSTIPETRDFASLIYEKAGMYRSGLLRVVAASSGSTTAMRQAVDSCPASLSDHGIAGKHDSSTHILDR